MIIIFAIFLTTVFAHKEKYIEILPDDDKQQFLDDAARRTMEYVDSNGINTGRTELTDERLRKHIFQQSVMEQETAALEARRNKREIRSSEEDSKSKENDDSKEDLEVEPFQFRDNDVDKLGTLEADDTDLAVVGMNRRNFNETPQHITDTPEADNVTEDTLSLQTKSVVSGAETTKALTIKNSNEERDKTDYLSKSTLESEKQMQQPVESTTETQIENTINTTSSAFDNNLQYKTTNETSMLSSLVTTKSSSQEVENRTIKTTTGSKIHVLEYDYTKRSNAIYLTTGTYKLKYLFDHFEPSTNPAEYYTQDSARGTLTSSLTDESTTNSIIDTTIDKKLGLRTTTYSQALTSTPQNPVNLNTTIKKNYSAIAENRFVNENSQIISVMTTFTPILTKSNIEEEVDAKKPNIIKFGKIEKQSDNDALVSYVARKALNKVKLEVKQKGKFIENEFETINKGNTHLNHYQVYEIPWPIKHHNQPFFKSQEPIKDQPYFIPVYKYSPNFAYYNSKNHHGPNKVVEDSIGWDTNLREGNNDTDDKVFRESVEEIIHSTLAPTSLLSNSNEIIHSTTTTTIAPESGVDCDTAEKEFAGCEPSKETGIDNNNNKKKGATIADILSVTDEKDLLFNLEKLQAMGLPLMRSKAESKVNTYMNVLKDLILEDSKSLKQYDWLMTTVQLQSALSKILKLIKHARQSKQLYPTDLQVLRYMVFLYNFSLEIEKDNKLDYKLKKRAKLTRNKKKKKNKLSKEKSWINRVWKYLKTPLSNDGLSHLYDFLIDVQDALFDLHKVIRHIADVTKFDRQNWYGNLKQLYLSAEEKQLREVLLHISMSRLVDLVEHSCKHSLDQDFIQFVETNKKDAARIVEEMIFINDIVHEMTINKR